jgi:hypothetical protein
MRGSLTAPFFIARSHERLRQDVFAILNEYNGSATLTPSENTTKFGALRGASIHPLRG